MSPFSSSRRRVKSLFLAAKSRLASMFSKSTEASSWLHVEDPVAWVVLGVLLADLPLVLAVWVMVATAALIMKLGQGVSR